MATVLILLLSMMAVACCQGAIVVPVKAIPFPSGNISTIVVDGDKGKQPETNNSDGKINEVIKTNNVGCVTKSPETTTTQTRTPTETTTRQATTTQTTTPTETKTTQATTTTTQTTTGTTTTQRTTTQARTTTTEEEEDSGSGSGSGDGSGDGSGEDSENDYECPGDFLFSSELNKCYLFSKNRLDWFKARQTCWMLDSWLVAIESQEENDFLKNELEKRGDDVFTGGSDMDKEFQFDWEYEWDMSSFTYTDWAPGEPNNEGGRERCVELKYYIEHSRYYWNDAPCTLHSKPYICETYPKN